MNNIFNSVLIKDVNRNAFDLSHSVKLTTEFNKLVPFLAQEVYPNETWEDTTEVFARFAPLKAPILAHLDIKTFFFFVPWRLCWQGWRRFITDGSDGHPKDITPPALPVWSFYEGGLFTPETSRLLSNLVTQCWCNGSLADYLGFPTPNIRYCDDIETALTRGSITEDERDSINEKVVTFCRTDIDFPLMPFFAYQLVYDEYFRNPNIQEMRLLPWCNEYGDSPTLSSGRHSVNSLQGLKMSNITDLFTLRSINWASDYFTSALPFLQRGEDVKIPFGGDGKLVFQSHGSTLSPAAHTRVVQVDQPFNGTAGKVTFNNGVARDEKGQPLDVDVTSNHKVDVQNVDATINDLRRAFTLQRWREKIARVGSRYIEQIKAHFSQTSSDARLQRPEFLGGGIMPVIVSDTEQMSGALMQSGDKSFVSTPQGTLTGQIHSYGKSNKFRKHFEEHGILLGLVTCVPKPEYQNLYNRQWLRRDPLDFYFPEFQHLGEQEVKRCELYTKFGASKEVNEGVFGYQQRFAELRYIPSTCHGDFKDTLGYWTMNRRFDSQPSLNSQFVTADANNDIFAYTDDDFHHIWLEIANNITAVRPLDKYAIPTF